MSDNDLLAQRLDKLEDAMHGVSSTVAALTKLLKGEEGGAYVGLVGQVKRHHESLYGRSDSEPGVVQKVNTIHRIYVWALCSASAGLGMLALWAIQKVTGVVD